MYTLRSTPPRNLQHTWKSSHQGLRNLLFVQLEICPGGEFHEAYRHVHGYYKHDVHKGKPCTGDGAQCDLK